jgi:hypothetical protein
MTVFHSNVDNFDFIIEYFYIKVAALNETNRSGKDPIGMPLVIADTANPDGSQLPGIIIVNLGNGHIELIAHPARDRLKNLPFTLERHIFRQAETDLTDTNIHRINSY